MECFTLANSTLYIIDEGELGTLGFLSDLPKDLKHLISFLNKDLTKEKAKALSILYRVISKTSYLLVETHYQEILSFYLATEIEEN